MGSRNVKDLVPDLLHYSVKLDYLNVDYYNYRKSSH